MNQTKLIVRCFLLLILLWFVSCVSTGNKNMTDAERRICDSLGIKVELIKKLRNQGASPVEPFHYSLGRMYVNGIEKEVDPIHLKGLVFKAKPGSCERILEQNYNIFRDNGYTLFLLERHFGIGDEPDVMAILATTDESEILRQIKTDGINYDIDNDSLISVIQKLDKKYSLKLIGAGGDWCEFLIMQQPVNWGDLAKEAYAFCPDIVDQGTETVEALEAELKRTKRLYFWWD